MPFYQMTYETKTTIARQLRDLFSTPKGTLILDPDYGMDFSLIDTDVGFALDSISFKENIRNQLRRYVPRVNADDAEIVIQYHTRTGRLYIKVNDVTINVTESVRADVS